MSKPRNRTRRTLAAATLVVVFAAGTGGVASSHVAGSRMKSVTRVVAGSRMKDENG